MVMSKNFQDQEVQNKSDEIKKGNEEIAKKTVIFWSRCRFHRIANFGEEVRDGSGRIVKPEQSIKFYEHILSTEDADQIKYVRDSESFASKDVREIENMDEARKLTTQQGAVKSSVKEFKGESTESVEIVDGQAGDKKFDYHIQG